MKLLLSTVLSAFALCASAAVIAPGSVAKLTLTSNSDLCVASAGTDVGSQLTLASCDADLTAFEVVRAAPGSDPTQLALNATFSSGGPIACISASGVANDGPLFLDVCEDDLFQRWNVNGGTTQGPIVNAGQTACLTAAANTEGSAITFSTCFGEDTQEWTATLV
ncbi:unnamed protein product [Peniophora sp. CBMAI 1063]|nr:unnamed protein product [Peniophora sp. CBMAI 1063]